MKLKSMVFTMGILGMLALPLHALDGPQYGDQPTGPNWSGNDTTMVIEPVQTGNVDTIDYVPIYDDDLITVYMMEDLSNDYGYTIETMEDEPVIDVTYQDESIAKFTVRHTTTGDSAFLFEQIDYEDNGDSIYYGLDHSDHCLNQILLSITK